MPRHAPPRIAASLLRATLPDAHRDLLLAELDEEYRQVILPQHSRISARIWYWRQAVGSMLWAVSERVGLHGMNNPSGGLGTDFRDAWRGLLRAPAFSLLVIATFALGVGTAASVFSVLDAVVLRPLPYPAPQELVRPWPDRTVSKAVMERVIEATSSFAPLTGYYETRQPLAAGDTTSDSLGLFVGQGYFDSLGAAPSAGRVFGANEGDDAVIISGLLWQQLGGRSDIVGQSLSVGGAPRTVVGVMPASHRPLTPGVEFWLPMRIDRDDFSDYEGTAQVVLLGRLSPGATLDQAAADLTSAAASIHEESPASYSEDWVKDSRPVPLHTVLISDVRLALWMVMGAVICLLLIACANVSNLLMVRSAARRGEVAIRVGLGASPWRVVRLRIVEGLMLGLAGGGVGVLLAFLLIRVVQSVGAASLALGDRIATDPSFVAFAFATTLFATLISSVGPALAAARSQPGALGLLLKSGGRGNPSPGRLRVNRVVVGGAIALAVVLVIGSTLMLRTVTHLSSVDPGFDPAEVTTLQVRFPSRGTWSEDVARSRFLDEFVDSLGRVPGTVTAAAVSFLPMATGTPSASYKVEGVSYPADTPPPYANFQLVVGDYHRALTIPILRGRWFTADDTVDSPPVGIINETLVREAFGNEDPIGREITMFGGVTFQVVGVIGDTRQRRPAEPPAPEAFFAYRQLPFWPGMFLTLRTDGRAPTEAELRTVVAGIAPGIPISRIRPMTEVVAQASSQPRLFSEMLSAFGLLALLLGAVGIHGVVSQNVAQRLPEFSLRIALGATRRQVLWAAMAHALLPSVLGVGVGAGLAALASRGLASQLFGISAVDAGTFAGVPLLLLGVSLLATYVPARRATRVDPATALH